MKPKLTILLVALAAGVFAFAGCGDDDEGSDTGATAPAETATTESAPPEETTTEESGGSGGGETLQNPADASGQLKFEKDALTAKAGKVTIAMENPSSIPHAIAVRANGEETSGDTVNQGETSEVSVDLEAGEYEFFCPVAGHEQGGMKGTLTVE